MLFQDFFLLNTYKQSLDNFRMLQKAQDTEYINVNCVDPLGRTALLMAIDNENLEMVELLINYNVDTKDALLHSISEEFVEAVEVLLDHEDLNFQNEGSHVSLVNLNIYFYIYFLFFFLYRAGNLCPKTHRHLLPTLHH